MSNKRINLDSVLEADANRDQSLDEVGNGHYAPQTEFAQDQQIDWSAREEEHKEVVALAISTASDDKKISGIVMDAMIFFADELNEHAISMDDLIGIVYRMDINVTDSDIKKAIRKMVRKQELNYLKEEKKFSLSGKSRMLNQVVQFLKSRPLTR